MLNSSPVRFRLALLLLGCAAVVFSQDWATLDKQAEELYNKGDLKEAIRIAKLAVEAASDAKQSGRSLDRLGFFQYTSGDLKEGEAALRRSLDLRKDKLGPETEDYAESANDLALLLRDAGRAAEARPLAEEAVAIRGRVLGGRHLRVAESLNTLGSTLAMLGEYDSAIARFEEARAIHEAQPEPRDFREEYGTLCINLAGTYQRIGKYSRAESTFETGLQVLRVKPGVSHPAYSASLVAFASLQADLGHYAAAEKVFDEAAVLLPVQLGERHPVYASFLNNRASLYRALGKTAAAETDYRKSLELKRTIYPPNAFTIGSTLRNLARLVVARNRAEGEKLFQEAVDLYARNARPPAFDFSSALLGLAQAQRNRGESAAARATLERAFDVTRSGLSDKHPLYAAALCDLALVHEGAGEFAAAQQRLQEAIAIVTETHGAHHPDLARYTAILARIYDAAGEYERAEPLYRRSLEISDRTLADMLTVGSESDKAAALANLEDLTPALLAFQRRAGDRLPAARVLAFEAVARRKGRLLDALHDWGQTVRENSDAGVRNLFTRRQAMLQCEASLTIALGYRDLKPAMVGSCALAGTDLEGRYERLVHDLRTNWTAALGRQALEAVQVLRGRVDTLEAELSRGIPQFSSTVRPVGLADLRASLRPNEILVEFVASDQRYGAFLLSSGGDLTWVDLGVVVPVDRAVQDLIAAANDWSTALANNERRGASAAEQGAREAMRTLSENFRPVIRALMKTGVGRVRIAPDGMLNLVPFAAISDEQGRFLVERLAISYVSASRDLAALPSAEARGAGPVVVAVSPGASAKPARTPIRADQLERLAGAELEARRLRKWMPRALVLGERQATERQIKQLHRPALLHIIGHGVVRGNEDCRAEPGSPACGLTGLDPAARVMNLSAIVLEEAYRRGGSSTEDGMLTALELQTVDLRGTEMLVLSQCRMADGVPSGGGVYGMRRAAAIAGARSFVAPLWPIADATEHVLIDRFYRDLSQGKDRAEALRQAQLQLLRDPRSASFLRWAPVILSGDPGPLPASLFLPAK